MVSKIRYLLHVDLSVHHPCSLIGPCVAYYLHMSVGTRVREANHVGEEAGCLKWVFYVCDGKNCEITHV